MKWLPNSVAAGLEQIAYACKALQWKYQQLLEGVLQRSKQLLQQDGKHQMHVSARARLAATVSSAAAMLDMQQLAGDARALVASSRVAQDSRLNRGDASMLWEVHAWLVQHQLLDGRGLAGL